MRQFFLQTCYTVVGRTRNNNLKTPAPKRFLWAPKAMLFGVRLLLHWEELSEPELCDIAITGMLMNSKLGLVSQVATPKVLSYLRACRVNVTNLCPNTRSCSYRWFEREEDVRIFTEAVHKKPSVIRNHLVKTFYQEYDHVRKEHNTGRYLHFAHSYPQEAPEDGGAEGGHQGS